MGEDCDSMPFLKTGSTRVVKPFPNGWEMLLHQVSPGQVCLLTATCILSDWRHLARVIADQDLKAISILKDSLYRLIEGSSDFRRFIFSNYSISLFSMLNYVEVVSRILEDFEEKGIVKLKRGMIFIQDQEALAQTLQTARD